MIPSVNNFGASRETFEVESCQNAIKLDHARELCEEMLEVEINNCYVLGVSLNVPVK
jgi:hypothetical protein